MIYIYIYIYIYIHTERERVNFTVFVVLSLFSRVFIVECFPSTFEWKFDNIARFSFQNKSRLEFEKKFRLSHNCFQEFQINTQIYKNYIHIYIYITRFEFPSNCIIYIYMCVCVYVCVYEGHSIDIRNSCPFEKTKIFF